MDPIRILFLTGTHFSPDEAEIAKLKTTYPQVQLSFAKLKNYTDSQLQEAQIIVGTPRPEDLKKATNLKWLQTQSSGVGPYSNRNSYANSDILLTNAKGTYGRQIADHVMGAIIAHNHLFFTYYEQMKNQLWKGYFPATDLFSSTILIIGFGDIGEHLAKRAKAHEMNVMVIKRTHIEKPSFVDMIGTTEDLDTFLPKADYVVCCAASTGQTENLLNAQRIASLKKGAYIVNVGRGSLIDENALINALETGHIGGAALDVTQVEPLDPASKLWSLPNVLITPHSSGLSHTDPHAVFSLFFENLGRYVRNQRLKNLVDFSRNY